MEVNLEMDRILDFLKDGKWHDLSQLTEKFSLSESEAKLIVSFLREFDFIEVDMRGRKTKLHPTMHEFFNKA